MQPPSVHTAHCITSLQSSYTGLTGVTLRGVVSPDARDVGLCTESGRTHHSGGDGGRTHHLFFFFFITLGLELSDTKVYEP
jgi:hypothetical protein